MHLATGSVLTKFIDCHAERGSRCNHRRSAVWSVEELEQTRYKLILVLIMSQSAITTKTPCKYAVLTIMNYLKATKNYSNTVGR